MNVDSRHLVYAGIALITVAVLLGAATAAASAAEASSVSEDVETDAAADVNVRCTDGVPPSYCEVDYGGEKTIVITPGDTIDRDAATDGERTGVGAICTRDVPPSYCVVYVGGHSVSFSPAGIIDSATP